MADRSMLLSLLPLRQCDYDLMPGMPPKPDLLADVHLDSITTNQAAIAALFRVVNRYVGNLAPMPGVFPDYPEPVVRNTNSGTELAMMRWGMPPPPRTGGPGHEYSKHVAEEDDILRQTALAGTSAAEIASAVGRTESAVRARAYVLRVLLRPVGIRRSGSVWQSSGA
jgi:hypothetical protein